MVNSAMIMTRGTGQLMRDQLGMQTAFSQQLRVGAGFHHPTLIECYEMEVKLVTKRLADE